MSDRGGGKSASGYALRGFPRAAKTLMGAREGNNNYGRTSKPANTVHLSTGQPMTGGQKPLVKIQRAELVKFKRAPTQVTSSTAFAS